MKLARLALPVYVELLSAVVAVGLIDLLWVSGLGSAAVGAVTIATTTEHLALGMILTVATGTTVLVGRRDGREPTAPVIRTAWLLCGAAGLSLAVAGVLLREPLARLFTGDAVTAGLTADFYLVSMAGIPVLFAQTLVDGIFKGHGDTGTPMRTALLCNALVIALDPLFIYGLGLGVPGAALATVLARLLALAVSLVLLSRRAQAGVGRARANLADAAAVVRTGLPMSGDFLARSLVGMLLVDLVAGFGVTALAGYGIGMKIMLAGVMAFYALRQAALIRTARSGASHPAAQPAGTRTGPATATAPPVPEDGGAGPVATSAARSGGAGPTAEPVLRYGLATGAAVAAVLNAVAAPAAGLFTGDPAVAVQAVDFLRWATLYLVPFGGLIAFGGVLQASGRGGRLLAATLAGFAVQLPLAYALGSALGVTGVWLAMAAGAALGLAGAVPGPAEAVLRAARAVPGVRKSAPGAAEAVPGAVKTVVSPADAPERPAAGLWSARGRGPRSTRTAAGRRSGR
ncbi:MATE family efflux transporter [Planobispora siamensis]|uniref:Probable multidrug resistance protein NorM n=1 Tax=Planobispora siamensis TaxID=936338 RepID=A0A8J3SG56_9ACTN|nr:MATE family efflux transporter [Planobispora siamensis]GIH92445.1 MATE family efflux transporter [Planobispora siamensis]